MQDTTMCTAGVVVDRNVSIRPAKFDDLDQLRAMELKVFQRLAYPYFVVRQMFDVHRECWLVAEHPSGLVGYSLGVPTWDRALGWLLALAVDPRYRNQGYGRMLTLESLKLLRSMGVRKVLLTAEPDNVIAIALYRRVGFSVTALRRDYLGPGEDRVIMARPFAASASST